MSQQITVKCDECESKQHFDEWINSRWFQIDITTKSFVVYKDHLKPTGDTRDICSPGCLLKALSKFTA